MVRVQPWRAIPQVFVCCPEIDPSAGRSHKDEHGPTTFLRSHRGNVRLSENTATGFEASRCTWREISISRLEHCSWDVSI